MGEPKPFASLTSGLLARKGDAKPAMRRQNIGNSGGLAMGHEDLGWNDMGEDGGLSASGPFSGLSPMGGTVLPVAQPEPQVTPVAAQEEAVRAVPVPAIVEQRKALAERIGHVPEPEEPADAAKPKARVTAHPASTRSRKAKAAFTLRIDPERHLRLRLASAVSNRSAQQLMIEALDNLLDQLPQIDQLADQLPRSRAAG